MPASAPNTESTPAPEFTGPLVAFKDVSLAFDQKPLFKNISFVVERGETLIILGPAGCGKSVLLKLANGLLKPDSGSICVFGQEIASMSERVLYKLRAHIGMVFQESALFDSINVEDNVAYRLNQEGISHEESHRRVEEVLSFVALPDAIAKFPSELSGGMRRRVSIARAIVTGPELILYDSPTGGLDPITSTTIIELVMKQRDIQHTTSLVVTHRLQDAFVLATHRFDPATNAMKPIPADPGAPRPPDRSPATTGIDAGTKFLILNEGSVVFHGATEELVHTEDPWLKRYLE
ncbi:MAG: ATP-binding cassette domain-containing protein [Acidobacteriota bacterium]|nr:ATP-binding cassette domain-containing protein [Acidobacteriota bacterium]